MKDKPENKSLEVSNSIAGEKEEILADSFKILSSDLDLDAVIKNSLGIIIKRFKAEAACLFLIDLHNYKLISCRWKTKIRSRAGTWSRGNRFS